MYMYMYTCVIIISIFHTILVAPPSVAVTMVTSSNTDIVYFGTSLVLSCSVDIGYHANTPTRVAIAWYHGNNRINVTNQISISNVTRQDSNSSLFVSTLSISSLGRRDINGSLVCVAMATPTSVLVNSHVLASHEIMSSISLTVISKYMYMYIITIELEIYVHVHVYVHVHNYYRAGNICTCTCNYCITGNIHVCTCICWNLIVCSLLFIMKS